MIDNLKEIKRLFENGGNIIEYLKDIAGTPSPSAEAIAISYDFQAGNYIKKAQSNPAFESERATAYSNIINSLGDFKTIVEVGIGEATTFANVLPRLHSESQIIAGGFDISYSRIRYASRYLRDENVNDVTIFVGDLFNSAIQDNSIDIVYTSHALEPNGGREEAALKELFRITRKYLVLFEPSYELADDETKKYMDRHGYIKDLYSIAVKHGYKVIEHKLLFDRNPLSINNTGVMIVEKTEPPDPPSAHHTIPLACPVTKKPLELIRNNYYCKESLLLYPIVDGTPCLLPNNAIIATHYLDDLS